ncbi:MAG: pilus assembly PilX family protein [Steroidobacteraceae bacterium]
MSNLSMRPLHPIAAKRAQRGAALVVGMLLLLVLTLLAISGMNTASLELAMAGNLQYHENAFQAAETGVEQAIVLGMFNPSAAPQRLPATVGTTTPIPNTGNRDNFFTMTTPQLAGAAQPAIWGASWDSFSTYHFEVQSNGTSARNAVATTVQGVAVIAPWDSTITPGPGMPTTLTP